jgi:segregation and condensation protein A
VVEFLWASMALFDDEAEPDTATVYRPLHFDLYTVADARDRILRLLAAAPRWVALDRLLPDAPEQADHEPHRGLRRRSAWSSTFMASLELARQGDVALGQGGDFRPIHVVRA